MLDELQEIRRLFGNSKIIFRGFTGKSKVHIELQFESQSTKSKNNTVVGSRSKVLDKLNGL